MPCPDIKNIEERWLLFYFSIPNPMQKKKKNSGGVQQPRTEQKNEFSEMFTRLMSWLNAYTLQALLTWIIPWADLSDVCCIIFSYPLSLLHSVHLWQLARAPLGLFFKKELGIICEKSFQLLDGKMTLTKGSSRYTPAFKLQSHSFEAALPND